MIRRLWRHRAGRAGLALAAAVVLLALLGPLAWPYQPDLPDYARQLTPPDARHWLGTDAAGRDQLARVLAGTGTSLTAVAAVFALTALIGLVVGAVAGFLGGPVDAVVGRTIDVLLGLPPQITALAIVGALGVGTGNLVVALVLAGWAYPARIARAAVLGSHRRLDVLAARLAGIGRWRILTGHVLPGAVTTVLVAATTTAGETVLTLAGLSFLGLGAQPPAAELGQLLADSQSSLVSSPWLLIGPTAVIAAMVAAAMLTADALADITDPAPAPARAGRRARAARTGGDGALVATGLSVRYPDGTHALRGVDLTLAAGTALAVVGESGCGKTTLARTVLRLLPAGTAIGGAVHVAGRDLLHLDRRALRRSRGYLVGYVAQDPYAACDPLRSLGHHVAAPWRVHRRRPPAGVVRDRIAGLGIDPGRLRDRPHRWSGGMVQRATIAAATAHRPAVTVADEPTSALDAGLAEEVLATLRGASSALLLVTHDLRLAAAHSDRVAVMYAGRIIETGRSGDVLDAPRHPYTAALLAATPRPDGTPVRGLPGSPPSLRDLPAGCPFAPRCDRRVADCASREPTLSDGVACWNPR
ncbi:peptide ABC transporter ATP-binding protein [Pilimelia terevasa]|uniref:Peptide ABC transporter ATP-binding protein n=1 Tax=Pilimelia terevasa TaxID=53372 RepID=A0A8J3FM13_9ACTN|nr:dipeptide/oligopeptide/nickel ABC transporter permease/ATP-binding protein [Pilimelia terevasa]GGK41804.1 peptide ABC transporter ATP-binding protein [Pilimelia terevasa]